ncbi:MAG: GNAT family N-acetyltransferase, partial [Pseudomonadota bacterium]
MPDPLALPDPALAARFAGIFAQVPSQDLIANINCTVGVESFGDLTMPVTRSDPPNGYLCSPSAAYLDYGAEETRHFTSNPVLRLGLLGLLKSAAPLLRAARLDRQVQINNWLFSTCPAPPISAATAVAMRGRFIASDPDRAIVIRSLNDALDSESMAHLAAAGFFLLPARQIYIADHRAAGKMTKDMRKDRKLLRTSVYAIVDSNDFAVKDFSRA